MTRNMRWAILLGLGWNAVLTACDGTWPLAPSFAMSKGATVAAPGNLTATASSYEAINLSWQDNATNEDGFEVWRSITGPTGTFTLFTTYPWPNTTQGGNSGLQPSTQYCYQVRAYKGKPRPLTYSDFSNVACATTLALPLPTAPSGVHAAPSFYGWIEVTWADSSSNESGFRVERSATSSGPWATLGTTGANATLYTDYQPPSPDQPACYRVFAFNSFGDSPASNVACTAMPAVPTDLVATALDGGSVDLTWTDNSSVEDGFALYRWTAQGPIAVITTLPANSTSYHDPWVGDSTYTYQVRATKDRGSSSGSNNVTVLVATVPPNTPANVAAVPNASTLVVVSWTDESANEAGFRVERSTDGGASWVSPYSTTGPNTGGLWDDGALAEQQVCYRVVAFNLKGDSPPSNTACTTPPAAPTGFTATGIDSLTVDFTWVDNSAVEDGYAIAVGDYAGYWDIAGYTGPDATSFRLTGNPYALYASYFVMAYKDGGFSDPSNAATPTSPAASASLARSLIRAPRSPMPQRRPIRGRRHP